MKYFLLQKKRSATGLFLLISFLLFQGCSMQWGAEIQWDSQSQILMSEDSQVKMRAIQTRVFDTTDKIKVMHAVVNTMQDLYFDIDVLNEDLGILSGKKMYHSGSHWVNHSTYYRYRTDELIIFSRNYWTYGPFQYRNDLTRMTVTIRPRGKTRLLVRASVQYNIRAVEDPAVYQKFFKLLSQSLFLEAQRE